MPKFKLHFSTKDFGLIFLVFDQKTLKLGERSLPAQVIGIVGV